MKRANPEEEEDASKTLYLTKILLDSFQSPTEPRLILNRAENLKLWLLKSLTRIVNQLSDLRFIKLALRSWKSPRHLQHCYPKHPFTFRNPNVKER